MDDHAPRHTEPFRQAQDRLASLEGSHDGIDIHHYRIVHVAEYPTSAGAATVYNLAVEQDESYIAEGFVVHNCACSPLAYYRPEFQDAISRVADDILKTFGRF